MALSLGLGLGLAARRTQGAPAEPYVANAVNFDGTNDYLTRGGGLTGQAASKRLLLSFWLDASADGVNNSILYPTVTGTTYRLWVAKNTGNNIAVVGKDSSNNTILSVSTPSNSILAASGWQHVLASFDMADTAKRQIAINDALATLTITTYTDASIAFDQATEWVVGARGDFAQKLAANMADLQMWLTYLDLSVESNRRLFIDESGKPVDPAIAAATLGTPIIRLTNALDDWQINVGSGGGFTEVGALTAAPSSPSS